MIFMYIELYVKFFFVKIDSWSPRKALIDLSVF